MACPPGIMYIDEEAISALLKWEDVLPEIENALKRYSSPDAAKDIVQPVRTSFRAPGHASNFYSMPCYVGKEDVFCAKLLTANPENAALGLATHHAIILLFEGNTGVLKALLTGERITAMRTAAASAIATKYLVNGTPKVLAILGSGTQARSHYEALKYLYNFTKVKVWNIRAESGQKFVHDLSELGETAAWCETVREAVEDADVICMATAYGGSPILDAPWVKPGAHINTLGANQPQQQEVDPVLMRDGIVYVDCRKAAQKESGDIILSGAKIFGEIGEVIGGAKEALAEKTTIFKSSGIAIEDAVIASLAHKKFLELPKQPAVSL